MSYIPSTGGAGGAYTLVAPVAADFSTVNQGSATINSTSTAISLYAPANGSISTKLYVHAVPGSTPYTIEMGIRVSQIVATYIRSGVCLYDSVSGKIISLTIGANGNQLCLETWTNTTTYVTNITGPFSIGAGMAGDLYFKITDDGTTLTFFHSCDAIQWVQIGSQTRAAHMSNGPTGAGLFIDTNNGTYGAVASMFHYKTY